MSCATHIPETDVLDGEHAGQTLTRVRLADLAPRAYRRLRAADGFSHARAFGLQIVLSVLPGLIFFAAAASWTGNESLVTTVESTLTSLIPGPTAEVFLEAIDQAEQNARGSVIAMLAGGFAALSSGAVAMSQMSQGADRIYGKDGDRSWGRRYGMALGLAVGVGLLLLAGFFALASGDAIAGIAGAESVWLWLRWPLGILATIAAVTALYKVAPDRHQPPLTWLLSGGLIGSVLWAVASIGLSAYLTLSSTFGEVYGPLAGFVGLLLWAQFSAFALLGGMAFSAQLEADRAGLTTIEEPGH